MDGLKIMLLLMFVAATLCQEVMDTAVPEDDNAASGGERQRRHIRVRTLEDCMRATKNIPGTYSNGEFVCECRFERKEADRKSGQDHKYYTYNDQPVLTNKNENDGRYGSGSVGGERFESRKGEKNENDNFDNSNRNRELKQNGNRQYETNLGNQRTHFYDNSENHPGRNHQSSSGSREKFEIGEGTEDNNGERIIGTTRNRENEAPVSNPRVRWEDRSSQIGTGSPRTRGSVDHSGKSIGINSNFETKSTGNNGFQFNEANDRARGFGWGMNTREESNSKRGGGYETSEDQWRRENGGRGSSGFRFGESYNGNVGSGLTQHGENREVGPNERTNSHSGHPISNTDRLASRSGNNDFRTGINSSPGLEINNYGKRTSEFGSDRDQTAHEPETQKTSSSGYDFGIRGSADSSHGERELRINHGRANFNSGSFKENERREVIRNRGVGEGLDRSRGHEYGIDVSGKSESSGSGTLRSRERTIVLNGPRRGGEGIYIGVAGKRVMGPDYSGAGSEGMSHFGGSRTIENSEIDFKNSGFGRELSTSMNGEGRIGTDTIFGGSRNEGMGGFFSTSGGGGMGGYVGTGEKGGNLEKTASELSSVLGGTGLGAAGMSGRETRIYPGNEGGMRGSSGASVGTETTKILGSIGSQVLGNNMRESINSGILGSVGSEIHSASGTINGQGISIAGASGMEGSLGAAIGTETMLGSIGSQVPGNMRESIDSGLGGIIGSVGSEMPSVPRSIEEQGISTALSVSGATSLGSVMGKPLSSGMGSFLGSGGVLKANNGYGSASSISTASSSALETARRVSIESGTALGTRGTKVHGDLGMSNIGTLIGSGNVGLGSSTARESGIEVSETQPNSDPKKEVETVNAGSSSAAEQTTTESTDYDEEDECDGGFEFLNKIFCIFKIIYGLLFGNADPCCPLEIPSLPSFG